MRARQNNHPGVEWFEVDLSQYFDDVLTSNSLVIGFAHQGKSKTPIDFITSTETLKQYFGEPQSEAEIYFYSACQRILTQKGRLIAVRIPYVNEAENCVPAFTYAVEEDTFSTYTANATYIPVVDVTSDVVANLANRGLTSLRDIADYIGVTTPTDDNGNKIFPGFSRLKELYRSEVNDKGETTIVKDDPLTMFESNSAEFGGATPCFAILVDKPENLDPMEQPDGTCNANEDSRFLAISNVVETPISIANLRDKVDIYSEMDDESGFEQEITGIAYQRICEGLSSVSTLSAPEIVNGTNGMDWNVEGTYEVIGASDAKCFPVEVGSAEINHEGTFLTKGLRSGYYIKSLTLKVKFMPKFKFTVAGSEAEIPSDRLPAFARECVLEIPVDLYDKGTEAPPLDGYYRTLSEPKRIETAQIYKSEVFDVSNVEGVEAFFGKGAVPEELKRADRIVRVHRDSKIGYLDSGIAEELEDGDMTRLSEALGGKTGFVIVNQTNQVLKADRFNNNGEEVLGIVPFVFTGFNKLPLSRLVTPSRESHANSMVWQCVNAIATGATDNGKVLENVLSKNGFSKSLCTYGSYSALDDTVSNQIASYFPALVAKDGGALPGEEMNYVAVVVAELKTDPNYDNKVVVNPKEMFYGNFDSSSAMYLPRLVNENSDYIYMYSNYEPSAAYSKDFENMVTVVTPFDEDTSVNNFWFLRDVRAGVLGYTSPMCTKLIKYKYITDTLDKVSNLLANVDEEDIDIVVDAGLTSIANLCVKAMGGEDNATGVRYDFRPGTYVDFDGNVVEDVPTLLKGGNIRSASDIAVWKTIAAKLNTFCEVTRKDCYAYIDGPRELSVNYNSPVVDKRGKRTIDMDILPYIKYTAGLNSSYGGGVLTWVKEVDDFTGRQYWCPPSVLKAEKTVWCDLTYGYPWYVPAGTERGTINDGIDVSFNPSPKQEDVIYPSRWNYVKNIKGDGIVLWGQRNFLTADSMLNRESTRRMMLFVERKCRKAMKRFLFKPISTALMNNVVDTLNPILQDVQDHEGCYDYLVVCNGTNNTPESIMRNELRVSVGIHPTPLAEYIVIGFYCVGLNIAITEELLKH